MKTPEGHQCFSISPCQWGCSGGYSCRWICFNIYLSIIYFIWCTLKYTMRQTCVHPNIIRSTKLQGAQHSPELSFRSTDFRVPENQIFPALIIFFTRINSNKITISFFSNASCLFFSKMRSLSVCPFPSTSTAKMH